MKEIDILPKPPFYRSAANAPTTDRIGVETYFQSTNLPIVKKMVFKAGEYSNPSANIYIFNHNLGKIFEPFIRAVGTFGSNIGVSICLPQQKSTGPTIGGQEWIYVNNITETQIITTGSGLTDAITTQVGSNPTFEIFFIDFTFDQYS